ncbi:MAG: hypothetical protein JST00_41380 [Deltaproteobacteria bacterium]|nr:hypothetical protein [Deltaproteobacteria bacterium]
MKSSGTRKGMVLGSLVVLVTALGYACAPEDENPADPRANTDGGSTTDTGATGEEGGTPLGDPICAKYGGADNVSLIADAILARVAGDCRISAPVTKLSPEASQHLTECFRIQIQGAFQCPGKKYESNVTVDSAGKKCRSMQQAHQGMNLRTADFNAFLEDVAAELKAQNLSDTDIRNIAPVFEGTRTGVVQQTTQPDRNTYCACENGLYNGKPCTVDAGIVDAGNDADAADAADADGG